MFGIQEHRERVGNSRHNSVKVNNENGDII